MILFLVLGFRDKNTGICVGAMPARSPGFSGHYQDLGSRIFKLKGALFCLVLLFLTWVRTLRSLIFGEKHAAKQHAQRLVTHAKNTFVGGIMSF